MNIVSTQLKKGYFQGPTAKGEGSTFGPDFDPFRGIKHVIEETVELGGSFVKGAVPGYGAWNMAQRGFSSGWSGNGSNMHIGMAGTALNGVGTLGLVVSAGQHLFGADPTIALGVSVAALAGGGIASAVMTARQ